MHKTITLRLDEVKYDLIRKLANFENRPISNFIEMATLKYIQTTELADGFEMKEIRANASLNRSLTSGLEDMKIGNGRFL